MPNSFKRKLSRNVGTSPVSIGSYTVNSAIQTTVIGLTVSNIHTANITATISHYNGSTDTRLVKDAPIENGGTLVVVGGDAKLVLEPGDSVRVTANTNSSVDAVMSILEVS